MSSSMLSQQEIEELMSRLQGTNLASPAASSRTDDPALPGTPEPRGTAVQPPVTNGEAALLTRLEVEGVQFPELMPSSITNRKNKERETAFFNAIPVNVTLELGEAVLTVRDILNLQKDSVIKLDKLAGENALLCINGKPLASGEVVVINDNFGCRVADFVSGGTEKVGQSG